MLRTMNNFILTSSDVYSFLLCFNFIVFFPFYPCCKIVLFMLFINIYLCSIY